ncbi:MAG TPA: hypothetical protein VGW10_19395 [Solirubrobacteraceae bacterium]|nr:hypothetical protein [Solirubrobacteraceae bacterium]
MEGHVEQLAPATRRVPYEVRMWRESLLNHAGFAADLARRLADDADYDLHELLNLVDRDCTPELAARILAPR